MRVTVSSSGFFRTLINVVTICLYFSTFFSLFFFRRIEVIRSG